MGFSSIDNGDEGRMLIHLDDLCLVGRHAEKIGDRLDQLLIIENRGHRQRARWRILRQGKGAGLQLGLARADGSRLPATWYSTAGWSSAPGDRNRACERYGHRAESRRAAPLENGIVQGEPHVLVGQRIGADGVFLAREPFFVNRKMKDLPLASTASTCIQTMRSSTDPVGNLWPVF